MEIIDNVTKTLAEDLKYEINNGSKLSIAAACFSIYAFKELKEELEKIDELRFIFTTPTYAAKERPAEENKEFFIPRVKPENSLYGTEFEVKLRNELTQKAVAKECAEWIKSKVKFKTNVSGGSMQPFINVDDTTYANVNEFSTVGLGCENGASVTNMAIKFMSYEANNYMEKFEELWNNPEMLQDVTKNVVDSISAAYQENSPEFIYYVTLYNIFREYLKSVNPDNLLNKSVGLEKSKIWNMLYKFQKDAVVGIIQKLEEHNGCILADSVGLGKTFTALAVIKYYQLRNKSILVLCPKKLSENWVTYKVNYVNNPISSDKLNYDVFYHTDLNRKGKSGKVDLSHINWGAYDLVVIDESHNFRNGGKSFKMPEIDENDVERYEYDPYYGEKVPIFKPEAQHKYEPPVSNRYGFLVQKIIKEGVQTKVLMLSATPVNNRFWDLRNQIVLAYEGKMFSTFDEKRSAISHIDIVFRDAQNAFQKWTEMDPKERTTEAMLGLLEFDFFKVLDDISIARSRKQIQKHYGTEEIGAFPVHMMPQNIDSYITSKSGKLTFKELFDKVISLNLVVYSPSKFILDSKKPGYAEKNKDESINKGFTQEAREQGLVKLMAINLLKRVESCSNSFAMTMKRIKNLVDDTIAKIDKFENTDLDTGYVEPDIDENDADEDVDEFVVGRKVSINLKDMDYVEWRRYLEHDSKVLEELLEEVGNIDPKFDSKLAKLKEIIADKVQNPINPGNKKILVFTAFADTAEYLYENLSQELLSRYGIHTALVSGAVSGRSTIPGVKTDFNKALTLFAPIAKNKQVIYSDIKEDIDVMIATDCISEGQNLQDCDCVVNYDIHWNPVRIIQRFGRIDRIGSKNTQIKMVNFWPDIALNDYLKLQARVENRMEILSISGSGQENILKPSQEQDVNYRSKQIEKLKNSTGFLEDATGDISITDLGLNEYLIELNEYISKHPDFEKAPLGLEGVAPADADAPAGVIYVLKNAKKVNDVKHKNPLHPYYVVYVGMNGEIVYDHSNPKKTLNLMRAICRGKIEPVMSICDAVNKETQDGRKMKIYSELLDKAIASVISVKDKDDVNDFITGKQDVLFDSNITGLDDFELISFLIVR